MVRVGRTKREDPARAGRYREVAQGFLKAARDLGILADPKYGNGLAVAAIHAAIAYTDALTVAYGSVRSTDGDHSRAAEILQQTLGHRADPGQVRRLEGILDAKTHASYSGVYYRLEEGMNILQELESYVVWAEETYQKRPSAS